MSTQAHSTHRSFPLIVSPAVMRKLAQLVSCPFSLRFHAHTLMIMMVLIDVPMHFTLHKVGPFDAPLTPVGQVMSVYSQHTGGQLMALPNGAVGGDIDVVATVHGATVIVTVANLNAVGWFG